MFDTLSGIWSGVSTPFKKGGDQTVWQNCHITFSPPNKIVGEGFSLWREKSIQFKIQGTWDPSTNYFSIYKTHLGEYTNKFEYKGKLDPISKIFQGQYRSGNFSLQRTQGFPPKKETEISRDSKVRSDEAGWDEDPESASAPKSEGLSFLSGNWQGSYTKKDTQEKTTWSNCHLDFTYENGQGKIRGSGDEGVTPFKVTGTFDLKQQWVTLHTQKHKTNVTYNLQLDLKQLMMRGESLLGTLILTKEHVSEKSKKQPTYTDFDKTMLKVLPEPIVTSPRSPKSPDPLSSPSSLPSIPSRDSFGTQPAPSGRCSLSPSSRSRRYYDSTERFGERRFNDVALDKVRRSGVRDNESGPSFVVHSDLDSRLGGRSSVLTASRSVDVKHSDLSDSTVSDDKSRIYHTYRTLIDKFIIENNKQDYGDSVVLPEISDSFFSKKQAETLADFRSRHHISDEDHAQVLTCYKVKDGSISPHSAPTGAEEFSTILQSRKSYEQDLGPDEPQASEDNPSPYGQWDPREASSSIVVPTAVVPPIPVASTSELEEDDMPEVSVPYSPIPPSTSYSSIPPSAQSPPSMASSTDIPQHSSPRERESSSDSGEFSERETCVVCMNARIDCVILPCGHLAICLSCCSELSLCPLCRKPIRHAQKIFRA